ncbi:zinc-binding alcohol dehydrogenase family protein [Devosia sp.]|uniref:zinc-binding alcohol dehydrogenase family protein n=1 Tax=Devosia sp. TaxID=1871048 RepID=UPI002FC87245
MDFMEALECTEPGILNLVRRPVPVRGADEVLVRPRRMGICGTDFHIYEGKHPFLAYPRIMGHELAVEVVEAPSASGFARGEMLVVNPYIACGSCVACRRGKPNCCTSISVLGVHRDGGMAGLLTLPAVNLIRAEGLSLDACATVEFLAIGAHAIRRARLDGGERVLVIGAGPIGLGVSLFAAQKGVHLTVMDRDQARLNVASGIVAGISTIVAGDESLAAIHTLTDGDGFDVVFDATGNAQSIESGFNFVAHGGSYVLVSVVKGDIRFVDADFHRREMSLLGSRNATDEDFTTVISAIRDGSVNPDALITHRTTLAAAAQDMPRWASDKTGLIKAIVEID